ncbi:MAG: hypothetical protein IKR94_05745 [Bacteroidales bacterium]|nr:hypothetical protein [Bacteroidales bacterium]
MKTLFKLFAAALVISNVNISTLSAQDYPYDITTYPFVRYDKNKIHFSKDSSGFVPIYQKLDSMIMYGKGHLNIVQLGASHTQADVFSNQVRYRLQTFHPGLVGARGFVFPYRMTKSNNPSNYSVEYSGFWTTCRNIEYKKNDLLGLGGVSATTLNPNSTLKVVMNPKNPIRYDLNRVLIFTEPGANQFEIVPDVCMGNYTVTKDPVNGIIEYNFDRYSVDASFHLQQTDSTQNHFTFYGMSLENDNPGITYHAIGINGARIPSWTRCSYFSRQLAALKPDMMVIYLGVNDGNTSKFSQDVYYNNYISLIEDIRYFNPKVQFVFIVPNDYFLLRRHPNPAVQLEQNAIEKLVNKYNASMYSIYDVMGGLGSCIEWLHHGLMAYDKVHFSIPGYTYTGNLFFNAFLRTYDNYLEKK